jgi:hypothetical protein
MGLFSNALRSIHQLQGRIQFHLPNEDADTRADIIFTQQILQDIYLVLRFVANRALLSSQDTGDSC